jgi:hypothetical protein
MATKSLDGALTKKAHIKQQWSEEQIQDMLSCMDPELGYLYFARKFFHIQHPVKGKLLFSPFEYQERLLSSYHNNRFNCNLLPRQSGKALSLDTKLPTASGDWVTMGTIAVGDLIVGSDGKSTMVTFATDVMHNRPCFEVEFDTGEIIVADAEHLWKVESVNQEFGTSILTTVEINQYMITHLSTDTLYIDITHPIQRVEQSLVIPPYILGVWLGAGDTNSGNYRQSIENIEIIDFIALNGYSVSSVVGVVDSEMYVINELNVKLSDFNLLTNKYIPSIYLKSAIRQRVELLQGLMDSIGSCDCLGNCELSYVEKSMILSIRELLSSLGIKTNLHTTIITGIVWYNLTFRTIDYDVFKLTTKLTSQKSCADIVENKRLYITEIRSINSVPVRCIQVDNESHMFLCGDTMIPTHNTTCASAYLLWYAMFHPDQTILVAAHKFTGAQEIMQRIRYGYELCPDFLRAGVISYNKGSMEFDNGSRIVSQTTTGTTGRGMSISLLYCLDGDSTVKIRNKITLVEEDITLHALYVRLYNPIHII